MSETIPDDILSAAVAVVDRGYDTGLIDAVAAALMAERERCAKIAESRFTAGTVTKNKKGEPYLTGQVAIYAARKIAAAIRTPSTGEEQ